MKQPTPKTLGYRMPAEWEPQEAVWLAWPHNELTWPGGMLVEVEQSYIEIIRALHTGQKIKLLVKDSESEARVRTLLGRAGTALKQVIFLRIATEDAWIRDYGAPEHGGLMYVAPNDLVPLVAAHVGGG